MPTARMPHTHTTHAGEDSLAGNKIARLLRASFHFVHTVECCNANAKC